MWRIAFYEILNDSATVIVSGSLNAYLADGVAVNYTAVTTTANKTIMVGWGIGAVPAGKSDQFIWNQTPN